MGYRPVFFGVPGELPLVEKALAAMQHKDDAIIAAGHLSMGEFIAATSWCSLAFTNDSGPMYVFDSREVPVIAMFGPSNGKLYHPWVRNPAPSTPPTCPAPRTTSTTPSKTRPTPP